MTVDEFLDEPPAPGADAINEFLDAPVAASPKPSSATEIDAFLDEPLGDPSFPSIGNPTQPAAGEFQPIDPETANVNQTLWRTFRGSSMGQLLFGRDTDQADAILRTAGIDPTHRIPNRLSDEGLVAASLAPFAGSLIRIPTEGTILSDSIPGKLAAGTINAGMGLMEGLVSPAAALAGVPGIGRLASGAFAIDMARHVPGQVSLAAQAAREGDLQTATEAGLGAIGSAAFAGLSAKHAATRHPNVVPLREVPNSLRAQHEGPLPEAPPDLLSAADQSSEALQAVREAAAMRDRAAAAQPETPTPEQPISPPSAADPAADLGEGAAPMRPPSPEAATEPIAPAGDPASSPVGEAAKPVDTPPARPEPNPATRASGAETITGRGQAVANAARDEGIASGMPAEREERPNPSPGGDFFGSPESVEQQRARLEREAAAKAKSEERQKLIDRANAPLRGGAIDTTGDLLDPTQADNPLFAVRRPEPPPNEVPSASPPRRRPSALEDRPFSVIDAIRELGKQRLNLTEIRKHNPDWRPPPALRRYFRSGGGLMWDKWAKELVGNGALRQEPATAQELTDAIDQAWSVHRNWRRTQRAGDEELVHLNRQETQFNRRVLTPAGPRGAPSEALNTQDLLPGDTFTRDGHKFRVTEVDADPNADGVASTVTVQDGPKFGKQTIDAAANPRIFVDPGTRREAPVGASGGSGNQAFSVGAYANGIPVSLGSLDAVRPVQAPELVRLAQDIGVSVRARRMPAEARGVFVGDGQGRIGLNRELFELGNEHQLAATLAHEIGHAVDWAPDQTLKRGNILGRVATLREFLFTTLPRNPLQSLDTILKPKDRARIRREAERAVGPRPPKDEEADLAAWQGEVSREYAERILEEIESRGLITRDDLHAELWALSQEWRPLEGMVTDSHLAYRMSSKEIYADAISVLLNNPGLLEARAPNFYKLFFDYLDRKPAVREAFLELQTLLSRGEAAAAARQREIGVEGFVKAEEALKESLRQDEDAVAHSHGFRARVMQESVDRGFWLGREIDRLRRQGVDISPDLDPRVAWEEANWADNENALTCDAVFKRVVEPLTAAGVDVRTLSELLKYERIAGGLGARAMLQMRLSELGRPEYKRLEALADDLSRRIAKGDDKGKMLATLEAMGQPADLIDEIRQNRMDAGTRSGIANPAAESPESVQALLRSLEASMTPAQWTTLRGAAEAFRSIVYEKMRQGVEHGIINRHTFETTITANQSWYATFRGLDHVDEHVTPYVRRAIGSVGDIEGPFYTTLLKCISLNNVMLRNRAKLLARDQFMRHTPESWQPAKTYHNGRELKVRQPEKGLARLQLWEDGRMREYDVDPYLAAAFETITPAQVHWAIKGMDLFWKGIYPLIIKYNPAFQLFTNPIRDFGRTSRNYRAVTGRGGKLMMAREYLRSFGDARAFVAGDLNNPVVRAMMEAKAIGTPMEGFGQSAGEPATFAAILERHRLMTPPERTRLGRLGMYVPHAIQRVGAVFEALPKVAAFRALKRDMGLSDRAAATTIRRYIGTPDFKVKGQHGAVQNVVFPFLNIFLQGYRGDLQLATRPTTRGGYWMQYLMHNGSRAMLIGLAAAGVFGDKLKELFGGASEYDRTNYDVVPLGYQAGGEHGRKTIYLRIPRDEASRVLSGMVYKLTKLVADAAMGNQVSTGRVANDLYAIPAGVVPSLSPVVELARSWNDYLRGVPPIDNYRNRPVVPDRAWAAGGWDALKPMIHWSLGKTGALNLVSFDPDAETTTEAVVSGVPVLRSLLKISDYGHSETQRDAEQDQTRGHAQVRVRYDPEVVSLQREHDRLQRLGKDRTPEQSRRYLQLRAWDANYRHLDEMAIEARDRGNAAHARALAERINTAGRAVYQTLENRRNGEFRYEGPLSER